jgi:hypothetical protein
LSSVLLLSEGFDNFKPVGGMMLPNRYTIDIGEGYGRLIIEASEWSHNAVIDSRFFKVQD